MEAFNGARGGIVAAGIVVGIVVAFLFLSLLGAGMMAAVDCW
jgi:hypothetical protein